MLLGLAGLMTAGVGAYGVLAGALMNLRRWPRVAMLVGSAAIFASGTYTLVAQIVTPLCVGLEQALRTLI